MSKAKNKTTQPALKSYEDRLVDFQAGMVKLVQDTQVGLRPYLDKYGPKMETVDIVQLEADAKANQSK